MASGQPRVHDQLGEPLRPPVPLRPLEAIGGLDELGLVAAVLRQQRLVVRDEQVRVGRVRLADRLDVAHERGVGLGLLRVKGLERAALAEEALVGHGQGRAIVRDRGGAAARGAELELGDLGTTRDGGEADDKIIAVFERDDVWNNITDITDIATAMINRLTHYFSTYKMIYGEPTDVSIETVYGVDYAKKVIEASIADYRDEFGD